MSDKRPGKSQSLKVLIMSIKRNVVNPIAPVEDRKDRVEDTGKSKSQSVMDWIEVSVKGQIEYSTGNGADFQLVLLIEKPEVDFNHEEC